MNRCGIAPCSHSPIHLHTNPDCPRQFGAAIASYQIEGATHEDGRLPSIWDTFSAMPGKVLAGDTGEVACDHYHRWESDLDLLCALNVDAYRLSIAWPRVMDEAGRPNQKGIDFYKRVIG